MNLISRTSHFPAIDPYALTEVLRQRFQSDDLYVVAWSIHPLRHFTVFPTTGGVYRLSGQACMDKEASNWSMIVKIIRQDSSTEIDHMWYWKREPLVYKSALLTTLPGSLRTARCYAVTEPSDREIWIWLEDLVDQNNDHWPLSAYGEAAYALGQFNGMYADSENIPSYRWLTRNFLTSYSSQFMSRVALVCDPLTWRHPQLREAFQTPVANRLLAIHVERDLLLRILEKLPQALCHSDFGRDNLFITDPVDGDGRVVATDWSCVGIGAVGQDLATLNLPNYRDQEQIDPARIEDTILPQYIRGLRSYGWNGSDQLVQIGFHVTLAVRWTYALARNISWIVVENRQSQLEAGYGRSLHQSMIRWAAATYYVLDRFDDVRPQLSSFTS